MVFEGNIYSFCSSFPHSHGNKRPCAPDSRVSCLCPIQPDASVSPDNKRRGHPAPCHCLHGRIKTFPLEVRGQSSRQVRIGRPGAGLTKERSCLINLINFFEWQQRRQTGVKGGTIIHPAPEHRSTAQPRAETLWRCCWGLKEAGRPQCWRILEEIE